MISIVRLPDYTILKALQLAELPAELEMSHRLTNNILFTVDFCSGPILIKEYIYFLLRIELFC